MGALEDFDKKILELRGRLKKSTPILRDFVKEEYENSIEEKIYSRPTSIYYNRTYDLLNSVDTDTIETINTITIGGYINPEKMSYSPFIAHSNWGNSRYNDEPGSDMREYIADWLNEGTAGGIIEHQATYFKQSAQEKIIKKGKLLMDKIVLNKNKK